VLTNGWRDARGTHSSTRTKQRSSASLSRMCESVRTCSASSATSAVYTPRYLYFSKNKNLIFCAPRCHRFSYLSIALSVYTHTHTHTHTHTCIYIYHIYQIDLSILRSAGICGPASSAGCTCMFLVCVPGVARVFLVCACACACALCVSCSPCALCVHLALLSCSPCHMYIHDMYIYIYT